MYNKYTTEQQYRSYHIILPSTQTRGKLLLGDFNAAVDQIILKQEDVKTIITAAAGFQHLKVSNHITHIVFPLSDAKTQNISKYFEESYQIIQENLKRGGVLVHCGAGVSRSATIVIAYYMKKTGESFKNAIHFIRNIRSNICPNLGFELQLKKYQIELGTTSRTQQFTTKPSSHSDISSNTDKVSVHSQSQRFQIEPIKTQNKSFINFQPDFKKSVYKIPQKKPYLKQYPRSKPKQQSTKNQRKSSQMLQTELFISGKGAYNVSQNRADRKSLNSNHSQVKNNFADNGNKNLLGTWSPALKDFKKLEL